MITTVNTADLRFMAQQTTADPKAIQVDAWLGDLYLGKRIYANTSIKKAVKTATNYIRINGSLH
jgi:hypothetical protein